MDLSNFKDSDLETKLLCYSLVLFPVTPHYSFLTSKLKHVWLVQLGAWPQMNRLCFSLAGETENKELFQQEK